MARENRIGVVHWSALKVVGDGEKFTVAFPAYFEATHIPYIAGVLEARLADVFEDSEIDLALVAGSLSESERGTSYDGGWIRVEGVSEPWPDAVKLRKAIDEAFVEAGEVEVEQRRRGEDLARHLLEAGEVAEDYALPNCR